MAHLKLYSDDVLIFDSLGLPEETKKFELFTPKFNLDEFFHGCTVTERKAINPNFYNNIFRLCQMLTLIREHYNKPITITSCYRDIAHNKRVGGVLTSQHLTASAVDFTIPVELTFVCDFIKKNLIYGQLIWYRSANFIHLSLPDKNHSQQYIVKDV